MTEPVLAGARRVVPAQAELPGVEGRGLTEERLLRTALGLFADHGYYGTSMRDLARAMNMKAASLYNHTASKERLLAELILLGHQEHARHIQHRLTDAQTDPVAQLAAFVRGHVEVHGRYPTLSVVTNSELHALPPALAEPSLRIRQQMSERLIGLLSLGQKSGDMNMPDVLLVAAAIGAMGMRVATWFDPHGGQTLESIADTYAELALRMAGCASATMPSPDAREPN